MAFPFELFGCALLVVAHLYPWLDIQTRDPSLLYIGLDCIFSYFMTILLGISYRAAFCTLAPLACLVGYKAKSKRPSLSTKSEWLPPATAKVTAPILQPISATTATTQPSRLGTDLLPRTQSWAYRDRNQSTPKSDEHHVLKYAKLQQKHIALQVKADADAARADDLERKLEELQTALARVQANSPPSQDAQREHQQLLEHRCQELQEVSEGLIEHLEASLEKHANLKTAHLKLQCDHGALQQTYQHLHQSHRLLEDQAQGNDRWLQDMKALAGDWAEIQQAHEAVIENTIAATHQMSETEVDMYQHDEELLTWGELQKTENVWTSPCHTPTPFEATPPARACPPNDVVESLLRWDQRLVPNKYFDEHLSDDAEHYPLAMTWTTQVSISLEVGTDADGCPHYFRLIPQVMTAEGGRLFPGLLSECHDKLSAYLNNGLAILAGVKPLGKLWPTAQLTCPTSAAAFPIWARRGRRSMLKLNTIRSDQHITKISAQVETSSSEDPFDDRFEIEEAATPVITGPKTCP